MGLVEFFPNAATSERRFRLYTDRNGLSFHEITALNEDASGNLWVGTNTTGLMKLARNGFITYGAEDRLTSVNSIFEDEAGGLCIRGSIRTGYDVHGQGLYSVYGRFDRGGFNPLRSAAIGPRVGWVYEKVTFQARNGEWWLGTGIDLYRFPRAGNFAAIASARPIARYTAEDGLAALQVYRLYPPKARNAEQ